MRLLRTAVWLCLSAAVLVALPLAAAPVTDDRGVTVNPAATPQRIITLAPHLTEMLFEIGAGERIVATVTYSDTPEQARKLPRIGDAHQLDIERIVSLQPDLVIGWVSGNAAGAIRQLEDLGIAVFMIEPRRLIDIADQLRRLGQLLGRVEQAGQAAANFEQTYQAVAQQYRERRPVTVFYEIWRQPLMTLSAHQFIGDALSLCGAANIFADQLPLAPTVTTEAVLAADPEIIITTVAATEQPATAYWQQWQELQAVQHNTVYALRDQGLSRPTGQAIAAVQRLCAVIDQGRQHYLSRP